MTGTGGAPRRAITLTQALPTQPYSDAVWQGDCLLLSGRIGLGTDGTLLEGGISAQTSQAIANIAMVLRQAGLSLDDVVRASVYLVTMDDYAAMNAVYVAAFSRPLPARTCVAVAALPLGACVEIEVTARRRG